MAENQYLLLMRIVDPEKRLRVLEPQQAFVRELRANGTIERVWRFTEVAGAAALINAPSKAEAERIYGESPFAREGVVEFEIREMAPVE